MNKSQLGRTGLEVSEICLGTMQFGWTADEAQSFEIMSAAYERGVNFIDTADIYSRWADGNPGGVSEEIIGRWRKQAQIPRDSLIIATKVRGPMGNPPTEGLSRKRIFEMVENSLRRLQIDYIDLYQAHWADIDVHIEETMRAFDDLIKAGKVRSVGCSNYSGLQLREALDISEEYGLARYETLQPHYSLVHRDEYEVELADICREQQIGVIPYSPLAAGFLTGKYRREKKADSVRAGSVAKYFTEKNWKLLDKMDEIAAEHNATVTQVALAWHLANDTVTCPIIGANSVSQLEESLGAVDFSLTVSQKEILDQLSV